MATEKIFDTNMNTDKLISLINKYVKSGLSDKEVETFSKSMYDFTASWYSDRIKGEKTPNMIFVEMEDDTIHGSYDGNLLRLNAKTKENLQSKPQNNQNTLTALMITIAHEMTHHRQKIMQKRYNSATDSQKAKCDAESKSVIDSYGGYKDKDYVKAAKYMMPYTRYNKVDLQSPDVSNLLESVDYGLYLSYAEEKHARKGGASIANLAIMSCLMDKKTSPEAKDFLRGQLNYLSNELDDKRNQKYITTATNFKKNFATIVNNEVSEETMLSLVSDYEGLTNPEKQVEKEMVSESVYSKAIEIFLSSKNLTEKQELLRNAMFNGNKTYGNVILKSIKQDPEFESRKEEVQGNIVGQLINCSVSDNVKDEKSKLISSSYELDYSGVLEPEQRYRVLKSMIDQDKVLFAASFHVNNKSNLDDKHKQELTQSIKDAMGRAITADEITPGVEPIHSAEKYDQLIRAENLDNSELMDTKSIYDSKFTGFQAVLRANSTSEDEKHYQDLYGKRQMIYDSQVSGDWEEADTMLDELYGNDNYRDNLVYVPSSESARVIDQNILRKNKEKQVQEENIY